MKKRNRTTVEKFGEKSVVSVLTTVTSKSTGGKHVDKYCLDCDKKISGTNWAKHAGGTHKGSIPSFVNWVEST